MNKLRRNSWMAVDQELSRFGTDSKSVLTGTQGPERYRLAYLFRIILRELYYLRQEIGAVRRELEQRSRP